MEIDESKKPTIVWQSEFAKLAIAGVFTLFDYFYLFLVRDLNLSFEQIINGPLSIATENLKHTIENNFSVLPLVVFWILVGVMAYLFYYSLEVFYYDLYVLSKVKKAPTLNQEDKRSIRIGATRILAHFLVILLYTVLLAACYLFVVPLARMSFVAINQFSVGLGFAVAFLGPILVWYAAISVLIYLYHRTTKNLHEESYWEEHDLTI